MCLHINIVPLFRPLGCYYKPQHRPSIPRLPPLLSHLPVSVPAASSGYRLYGRACLSGNVTHSCSQSHNIPALYSLCNPPPWQESKRGPNAHRPQYRSHLISSHLITALFRSSCWTTERHSPFMTAECCQMLLFYGRTQICRDQLKRRNWMLPFAKERYTV